MAKVLVDNTVITFTSGVVCDDPDLLAEALLFALEECTNAPNWANLAADRVADMMNGVVLSYSPVEHEPFDPDIEF